MLPAALRMRRSEEFARTIRRGARAGRSTLVVHCLRTPEPGRHVGFVVARTVGDAVVRNRVRRRLRGIVVEQHQALPEGTRLVVRALPAAAAASFPTLEADFRSASLTALRRSEPSSPSDR